MALFRTDSEPFDHDGVGQTIQEDDTLTFDERLVLLSAVCLADEYGQVRATQKALAESVSMPTRTVGELLDSERVTKYLEKEKLGRAVVATFTQCIEK